VSAFESRPSPYLREFYPGELFLLSLLSFFFNVA
jgi:hypothetical protein